MWVMSVTRWNTEIMIVRKHFFFKQKHFLLIYRNKTAVMFPATSNTNNRCVRRFHLKINWTSLWRPTAVANFWTDRLQGKINNPDDRQRGFFSEYQSEAVRCPLGQDIDCDNSRHIPGWDPLLAMSRRPLVPERVYHFSVIYNHAWCPLSHTDDTDLALRVTTGLVERLELQGYVNR